MWVVLGCFILSAQVLQARFLLRVSLYSMLLSDDILNCWGGL